MFKVTLLFLVALPWCLAKRDPSDLPPYIPKCSLSDPKFNECFVEAANKVIPILAKGDLSINIPSLTPITFAKAPLYGTGLNYILYDVYVDDWKNIVLTEAAIDFKNGKASFVGIVDRVESIIQNYTIVDGKMVGITARGHGKHNITLVGVKAIFQASLRFYEKGEDQYLDYYDSSADLNAEDPYFYFENIKSSEIDDVNEYISKNSKKFYLQIKPAVSKYLDVIVNSRIKTIMNAIPFKKIFLP